MAQDLLARARSRLALNEKFTAELADDLAGARAELERQVAHPGAVPPADWARLLGARQHAAMARAALAAEHEVQARVRADLAAVSSPGDVATHEALLRASLQREAALRVHLRQGRERELVAAELLSALGSAMATARDRLTAAGRALATTEVDQQAGQAVRAALTAPPLSTLANDAAAVRSGPAHQAALDRLTALLPDALRTRARHRFTESGTLLEAADEAHATARAGWERVTAEIEPRRAVQAVEAAFRRALAALSGYAGSSPGELATARQQLDAVAATAALSAEQVAALDPADRADAVDAATAEQELADVVAEISALTAALAAAVAAARIDDPDSDPEQDADVIAARAALDDPAVQQRLSDARAAYDQDARAALDAWEVEVPEHLWQALVRYEQAAGTLDRLASQQHRTDLVAALDTAQDALADALDEADVQQRRLQVAALTSAAAAARLRALTELDADRDGQYARGDGPSGRTDAEL